MASKTMKAARYYGAHDIRIEQIPVPEPEDGQVRIKIAYCGICGSDLHEYEAGPILCPTHVKGHGVTGEKLPICLGHEFSGTIEKLGAGLKGNWKVGDRVVVEPVIACGECYACENGLDNACDHIGFVGLSGWGGGLAEFVTAREKMLYKLPENVPFQYGAMVEPLAVAMHAVEQSNIKAGQTALILGAGPIGCFVVKALLASGVTNIIVSEMSDTRRKMAKHAGATTVLSPKDSDITAEVRKLTGGAGADVAFECAGVQATINTAITAIKVRGLVLNIAIWGFKPEIDMVALLLGEKSIKGVICYKNNHQPALDGLASGAIDLKGFVTSHIALDDLVTGGFKELIENNENHVKILVSLTGKD